MNHHHERYFVLTGGPGSGKTTLLAALARQGCACMPEAGRGIIQDQMEIDGRALPWRDPLAFAEMMLCWDMRSHRLAADQPRPVVFDRGVPDVIGYLRLQGLEPPAHMHRAAELFRYNRRVFILPPWPDIYRQDAERRQTPEEAERTYRAMVTIYAECGYELVEVPRMTVTERTGFLLARMGEVRA